LFYIELYSICYHYGFDVAGTFGGIANTASDHDVLFVHTWIRYSMYRSTEVYLITYLCSRIRRLLPRDCPVWLTSARLFTSMGLRKPKSMVSIGA
jgi:hypothetical protein